MEEKKEEIEIEKEKPRISILQIVFLILLLAAIFGLIYSAVTIVKYSEMLKNPMGYNIEQFGLKYCTCYDSDFRIVVINGLSYNNSYNKYIPVPEYNLSLPTKINYTFNSG
jgi:hypothetical protein